jgi:Tol biopolymer transport system component
MAPEQVRGQPADHRADIFGFGAVLFEMLTGQRAFGGDSAIEMMSAILKQDPLDQPAVTINLPGSLGPLLRHCLEKQPDERFQSARDLAFQLQVIAGASGSTSSSAAGHTATDIGAAKATPYVQRRGWLVPAAIALTAAIAGLGLGRYLFGGNAADLTSVTSTILLPSGLHIATADSPARSGGLAVSRDGRQVAFVGRTASGTQLFVRGIDSPVARPVAGTEGGSLPAWSPDGKRLVFAQGRQLKQVPAEGGAPQSITEMINPRSAATWGTDDTLLFHVEYRQGLSRVPVTGGTPSEVLSVAAGDVSWFSPVWLPDGRRFLVIKFAYADAVTKGAGIYAGTVDSKDLTLIVPGSIAEVAVGDEELFYRKGTELIAQPFDASTLKVSGNPRVISNHVSMIAAGGPTLVYFDPPGGLSLGHRITWLSRSGAVLSTTGEASSFRDPRISPDERSIAIARANETGVFGIWKYDIARNIDTKITGTTYVSPAWTRDSRSIIVGSSAKGVERFDANASGPPQLLIASYWNVMDVTGAGEVLVRRGQPVKYRLGVMRLDGSADPKPLSADLYDTVSASFSFDGKWIAMVGAETGTTGRLQVQPFPGPGASIPVSAMPARYPRWRRDNGELYFLSTVDGQPAIMAVPVTWNGGIPDFGTTQLLFKVPKIVAQNLGFDVTADGQRFVAIIGGEPDPSPLTMVVRAVVK